MCSNGISVEELAEQVTAVLEDYIVQDSGSDSSVQALLDILFEGVNADLSSWERARRRFSDTLQSLGVGKITLGDAVHRILTRIVRARLYARPIAANDDTPVILISPISPDS